MNTESQRVCNPYGNEHAEWLVGVEGLNSTVGLVVCQGPWFDKGS